MNADPQPCLYIYGILKEGGAWWSLLHQVAPVGLVPSPPLYIYSKGKEVRGGHSYTRLDQSVGSNPPPLPLYIYSKGRRYVAVTRAPGCTSRFFSPPSPSWCMQEELVYSWIKLCVMQIPLPSDIKTSCLLRINVYSRSMSFVSGSSIMHPDSKTF